MQKSLHYPHIIDKFESYRVIVVCDSRNVIVTDLPFFDGNGGNCATGNSISKNV